ncbi:MAG: HlyD family efflux transporter periplasmic adaptor subunit [Oscillospiraceae bacterium]
MKSATGKVLIGLVSLFFMFMVFSQVYFMFKNHRDTAEAVVTTVKEDIPFTGIIVRDETVLTYDGTGTLDYLCADGSKVMEGTHIAEVYGTADAVYARKRAEALQVELNNLKRAQNPGMKIAAQPETLLSGINDAYESLSQSIQRGTLDDIESSRQNLIFLSDVYNYVIGTDTDYSAKIQELKDEISTLKSKYANPRDSVVTEKAGYFIGYADGYEKTLTQESVSALTADDIRGIIAGKETAPANAAGKIADSYSCKITGIINTPNTFISGDNLKLMLGSSEKLYDVTVDSIKSVSDNGDCIVVLDCQSIDEALVKARVQKMSLVFGEFTGIQIPRSAIHFRGEEKGVYVLSGENVTFKKVDVIYQNEDFVISRNTADEDYVLMYDQILLEEVDEDELVSTASSEQT